jgi:hypothetical protein
MTTVTCPKCGTENPAEAMNCKNCRGNLKYALEHPGEMEFAREHPDMFGLVKPNAVQDIPVASEHASPQLSSVEGETEVDHKQPSREMGEQSGCASALGVLAIITGGIVWFGAGWFMVKSLGSGVSYMQMIVSMVAIGGFAISWGISKLPKKRQQ